MVQGFAFDTGDVGNLQPFLDYASIEYTANDLIGIRAGRVRKPGGIYNHIPGRGSGADVRLAAARHV